MKRKKSLIQLTFICFWAQSHPGTSANLLAASELNIALALTNASKIEVHLRAEMSN